MIWPPAVSAAKVPSGGVIRIWAMATTMKWPLRLAIFCCCAAFAGAGKAAESLQELATGGLDLMAISNPAALVLSSEALAVSTKEVKFSYNFANNGATPLTVMYNFKFPDLDFSDPDVEYAIPGSDPQNFLDASIIVDGRAARLNLTQRALLAGKDLSETLRQNKISLVPIGAFQSEVNGLSEKIRDQLKTRGLIAEAGTSVDGAPIYFANWTVRTKASGDFAIPPMGNVSVELKYRVSLGVSPDTVLRKALRDQPGLAPEVAAQRKDYCVDGGFLSGVDKIAGASEANSSQIREERIRLIRGYAGANMPKAIEFRLVANKGQPQDLISFCADNLKKISATEFEMKAKNFRPDADLKLLIIQRSVQNAGNHR
jgi:Domain of unknown function (DUF4424)